MTRPVSGSPPVGRRRRPAGRSLSFRRRGAGDFGPPAGIRAALHRERRVGPVGKRRPVARTFSSRPAVRHLCCVHPPDLPRIPPWPTSPAVTGLPPVPPAAPRRHPRRYKPRRCLCSPRRRHACNGAGSAPAEQPNSVGRPGRRLRRARLRWCLTMRWIRTNQCCAAARLWCPGLSAAAAARLWWSGLSAATARVATAQTEARPANGGQHHARHSHTARDTGLSDRPTESFPPRSRRTYRSSRVRVDRDPSPAARDSGFQKVLRTQPAPLQRFLHLLMERAHLPLRGIRRERISDRWRKIIARENGLGIIIRSHEFRIHASLTAT